jgi:hypothetical protein
MITRILFLNYKTSRKAIIYYTSLWQQIKQTGKDNFMRYKNTVEIGYDVMKGTEYFVSL